MGFNSHSLLQIAIVGTPLMHKYVCH